MGMFKYKVEKGNNKVTPVKYLRETDHFLIVPWSGWRKGDTERRVAKSSEYDKHFDTIEQAFEYVIKRSHAKIKRLMEDLEDERIALAVTWELVPESMKLLKAEEE